MHIKISLESIVKPTLDTNNNTVTAVICRSVFAVKQNRSQCILTIQEDAVNEALHSCTTLPPSAKKLELDSDIQTEPKTGKI